VANPYARAITPPERAWRWARREPLRAGLGAVALAASGLGLYLGTSWDKIRAAELEARAAQRQAWIEAGFEELRAGDVGRATELLRDALAVPPADPEALAGLLLATRDAQLLETHAELLAGTPDLEWVVMDLFAGVHRDPRARELYERSEASRSPLAVFVEGLGRLQGFDLAQANIGRKANFLVHTLIESKHARALLHYHDQFAGHRLDRAAAADPRRHLIRVLEAPEGDRVLDASAAGDVDRDGWGDVLVACARGLEPRVGFMRVLSGRTGAELRTYSQSPGPGSIPEPRPID
jgi:hypothetical protein